MAVCLEVNSKRLNNEENKPESWKTFKTITKSK